MLLSEAVLPQISVARRYNSFSLYVPYQINLASSGAISVFAGKAQVLMCPVPLVTLSGFALQRDPRGEVKRCRDDELISTVHRRRANGC